LYKNVRFTVKPDKTDPFWTTAHSKGLSIAVAGKETSFTIQPKDRFGNNELENQDSDVFVVFVTSTNGNISKTISGVIGQVSSNIDGSYNVRYTPTVSGKHTVAVVQATVVETQIITTSFNTLKRGGIFPLNFDEYDFVSIPWDINASTFEELILHRINGISNIDVSKQKIDHYNFRFIISFESVVGDLPIFKVNTTGLTGNVSPWNVKKTNGKFKYIMTVSPDEEIRAPLYGNSKLIYEKQRVLSTLADGEISGASKFILQFMGINTEYIAHDASVDEFTAAFSSLSSIGHIKVMKYIDTESDSGWDVTFMPNIGMEKKSLSNFGNMPSIVLVEVKGRIKVEITTIKF